MKLIKAVVDTNVVISAIFWKGNPHEFIARGLAGEYVLVTSPQIVSEVEDKLQKKFGFPPQMVQKQVDIMMTLFSVAVPSSKFNVVRDKTDNKIIECAVDSKSGFIVTGDSDLLVLKEFRGIKIVTPKEFLKTRLRK